MLVAVATSLVLMAIGILALRGSDDAADTSAGGLTITDEALTGQLLSSSSAGDEQGGRSDQRSAGAIDGDDSTDGADSTDDEDSSAESTVVVSTTEAPATTTTTKTTVPTTETTSDTKPSTSEQPTTATTAKETTTTESTVTTTVPKETTSSGPIYTILPPTTEVDNSATRKQLAAARERWRSSGFDSYSMVVARSCFCAPDSLGPFEIVVRNGEIQSIEVVGGDRPVADWVEPHTLTVPGLFGLVESSLDAASLDVKFDKNSGLPLRISIDRSRMTADDELTVTVDDFRPRRNRQ